MIGLRTEKITPMKNNNIVLYLIVFLFAIPTFAFTPIITNDCNGKNEGSITFDHFCYDAPNSPFTFTWQDGSGLVVYSGNTGNGDEIDLLNIGEGSYTLILNDQDFCQGIHPFDIEDNPCPEIIVSDPACGITTTDGFEICIGAFIMVEGRANGSTIESWDFGPDSEIIEVGSMVNTYKVYWGSPGNKTISLSLEGNVEVINTSVLVSTNSNVCPDIGVSYDFCSPSNVCVFFGEDIEYESSCYSIDNVNYPQIHYNGNSAPNIGGPFEICAGTGREVKCSKFLTATGYVGKNFELKNPFVGDVYIFARDESTGCSTFLTEITECESCTDGISINPDGTYGNDVFECNISFLPSSDDLVEINFHVECGAPPYSVSIDPPITLDQYDDFESNSITVTAMVENGIDYAGSYAITVTDSNGETASINMDCEVYGGTGGSTSPTCNNTTTDIYAPIFNSNIQTVYNYCTTDNICINYNVSEAEDGLFAVFVKNHPNHQEIFFNDVVENAQGQFCFDISELSIGINTVEVMATDKGACPLNHAMKQYTININDYNYLPNNRELNVINAVELYDFVYYLNCLSDQISLEANNGYSQYKWYRDGVLVITTSANQLNINQAGNYTVVYFDPNLGPCGTYISEYIFIYKIANEAPPLGYTFSSSTSVINNCTVIPSVNVFATGGSGSYEIFWADCVSGCNSSSNVILSGTKTATITDLCTGEVLTACFKKNSCNEIVLCSDVTPCQDNDDNPGGPSFETDLKITPTVYNESTTVKVTLAQESNVTLRYIGAMGGGFTNVVEEVRLPAGENDILVNTALDVDGVNVFILETDCANINRLGVKTN